MTPSHENKPLSPQERNQAFLDLVKWAGYWDLDHDIKRALEEDLGPKDRDVTSDVLIEKKQPGEATVVARQAGVVAGTVLLNEAAMLASWSNLNIETFVPDGAAIVPGDAIARLTGRLRNILRVERTVLNYLTHLSGVASLTARYVRAVEGTGGRIYDTRKTMPGLRWLQKYAVTCGGGHNHRVGLYDAMLIKDNHIAHLSLDELAPAITDAANRAREKYRKLKFVEVEVDTLDQLERLLTTPVDLILLDNMPPDVLRKAVELRNQLAPKIELEASGGVNLETVRAIAETGVDRIAIGALTHSAAALDIGLDIHA